MRGRPRRRALTLLAAVTLIVTACSDGDPRVVDGQPSRTPDSPSTAGPTAPGSPGGTAEPTEASPTASSSPAVPLEDLRLAWQPVVEGLDAPLHVTSPPGDSRLFVVEQGGVVRVLDGGELSTFVDISGRVTAGGERGLLGLAFHPSYAENGRFFLHYSGTDGGQTVLAEYAVSDDPGVGDPASERILLEIPQPASNHNGGTIAFGPDGMLYLGLGDGGAAGDRFGNGQRPDTLLGTILRLDVDAGDPYGIPSDNPFADGGGAPEVWAYGLRNPWKFTFDDGRLFIADVGQNAWEEVDAARADAGGLNFGWPILEGSHCFQSSGCDRQGLVPPAVEYSQNETGGCAVIGGAVYRGPSIPALHGHYLYSDLCAGFVRSIVVDASGELVSQHDWTDQTGRIGGVTAIGRDAAGEVYATVGDRLLRLVDTSGA